MKRASTIGGRPWHGLPHGQVVCYQPVDHDGPGRHKRPCRGDVGVVLRSEAWVEVVWHDGCADPVEDNGSLGPLMGRVLPLRRRVADPEAFVRLAERRAEFAEMERDVRETGVAWPRLGGV